MQHAKRVLALLAAALSVTALTTGVASATPDELAGAKAVIRYTEHGVPHIVAKDFDGLGYGYGFAAATDNICELANTYLTVDAQRSKYLGAGGTGNSAMSSATSNLNSDLYFQRIKDSGVVAKLAAQPAPLGPRREVRDLVAGYVKGYNAYLARGGVTDPACRGAAWVRSITEMDVYRHYYAVSTAGGQGQFPEELIAPKPPTAAGAAAPDAARLSTEVKQVLAGDGLGSNGIAIGANGTATGKGSVLLGNPHYPWQGGRRFWQSQLTIPGRFDVTGASLLGIPLIQIGHTADAAWTHTVASPVTFGLFEVPLAPGDPKTYLVDGKRERMTSTDVEVKVRQDDGRLTTVHQTFYATRYGPVISSFGDVPLPWSTQSAFALRDANTTNMRGLNTWLDLNQAHSTADVAGALSRNQGLPWVNTIATDRAGNALYADIQVVPHVTDEQAMSCGTPLGKQVFPGTGLSILDGSRSACTWGSDPGAVEPGLFAPSRLPLQQRRDYELNSNDSAWLANAHAPITGYPRIVGDIGTTRSPRTREALVTAEAGGFTAESMKQALFGDRSRLAELTAADTAKMCAAFPGGLAPSSSGPVPVGDACTALAQWDHTYRLGSRGALLFERFAQTFVRLPGNGLKNGFDPAHPVTTPNTLDVAAPGVQQAFGNTVAAFRAGGIPADAPLADYQAVTRLGERIPVHGAPNPLGVLNVVTPVWDPQAGNAEIVHGTSFVQVVGFSGKACPDASTLLTYSQSTNPASPYFADQTKAFSRSEWVRDRFCESDILRSPALRIVALR